MINFECKPFYDLSLDELYEILKLRQEVFVVEQECPYLDNDDKDQQGWHLLGRDAEAELVAYTRLLPKGVSYEDFPSIGRVITSQKIRRKGLGALLMTTSVEWVEKLFGPGPIKIGAQCYLDRFYQSLGFKPVGEPYMEDGIPHQSMIKE